MNQPTESAFPTEREARYAMDGSVIGPGVLKGGLTKREFIASMVLSTFVPNELRMDVHVQLAVRYADALLAELAKEAE